MQRQLAQILGPLQSHTLPHLQPTSIVALRGACKLLQHLVDTAPPSAVKGQCLPLLPSGLHGLAKDGRQFQRILSAQAAIVASVQTGTAAMLHQVPAQPTSHMVQALEQPAWPSSCLALTMWADLGISQVLLVDPGSLSQPSSPFQAAALERMLVRWAAWCRGGSHLVLLEERAGACSTAVFDIVTGSVRRVRNGGNMRLERSAHRWVSPAGDAVLIPQLAGGWAVDLYSLPGLQLLCQA